MKTCIVLMVLGFVAVSHQQNATAKQEFQARRNACLKETNAKAEDLKKVFTEGMSTNDKNLKCFFKCMAQKSGTMNEAGVLNIEAMKSRIPSFMDKAKAVAAIDKCKTVKATDPCEIAFEYTKCFHQELGPLLRKPRPAGN